MLAHQFSLSKPPSPKPKPSVGKKQLMRDTIEGAMQFAFSNLGEWCLVGTFTAKEHGSRKLAYARAYYYQERLEAHIAMMLNYHADAYPVQWHSHWNNSKKQYEVRVMADYRPDFAWNDEGGSPYVEAIEEQQFQDNVRRQMAEHKQVSAVKQAMDSLFFGGQS
jgi:hypothetical protein